MKNPIGNLGDYGTITKDLKLFNGCKKALYDSIGNTAVAKAAPSLLLKGGFIGAGALAILGGIAFGGYKTICFMRNRKLLIDNEPNLKKEFIETIKVDESEEACNGREES